MGQQHFLSIFLEEIVIISSMMVLFSILYYCRERSSF